MSEHKIKPSKRLVKAKSWSPDMEREAVWLERKREFGLRKRSFSNHDLEEIRACFELGFGIDSPNLDPKLSSIFPALGFYHSVTKQYGEYSNRLYRSSSSTTMAGSESENDISSSKFFDDGDDPEIRKIRLRQWAQVVAYKARRHYSPS